MKIQVPIQHLPKFLAACLYEHNFKLKWAQFHTRAWFSSCSVKTLLNFPFCVLIIAQIRSWNIFHNCRRIPRVHGIAPRVDEGRATAMSCSPATTTPPTKSWLRSWEAKSQRTHTNVQVGTQILLFAMQVFFELYIRLQCSLPTKCAGRQNSCVWWRRAFPSLDRDGCRKARRPRPSKVGSTIMTLVFFTVHRWRATFRSLATHHRRRGVWEEVGFQSPQDSSGGSQVSTARELQGSRHQVGSSSSRTA